MFSFDSCKDQLNRMFAKCNECDNYLAVNIIIADSNFEILYTFDNEIGTLEKGELLSHVKFRFSSIRTVGSITVTTKNKHLIKYLLNKNK